MADTGASIFLFHKEGVSLPDNVIKTKYPAGVCLPVAPMDSLSIAENVIINSEILPRRGAVTFGGGRGAKQISLNTIFPMEAANNFAHGHAQSIWFPYQYDELLRSIAQTNCVVDLVIGNAATPAAAIDNSLFFKGSVFIQSYNSDRLEGDDIYVAIEFIEWQEVAVKKVRLQGNSGPYSDRKGKYHRPGKKARPATVEAGKQNLAMIAKKYYDTTKAWKWIAAHPKNVATFGIGKKPKKKPVPTYKHKNLKAKTKVYLPDSTEKDSKGRSFWSVTGIEE